MLKRLDDFIPSRLKLCEDERLLERRNGGGVLTHGLIFLKASPLRVHGHLCAIEAAMKAGGNKAGHVANVFAGNVSQNVNELFLFCWIYGENVDQGDQFLVFVDGCHGLVEQASAPWIEIS